MLTKWRAVAITAVALLSLSLLPACGGGDADPTPGPGSPSPSVSQAPSHTAPLTATPSPVSEDPPLRDLYDLARRYLGLPADAPRAARTEPLDHETGDSVRFTLLDLNVPSTYEVSATVRAVSEHAYFFVQDGTSFSESALSQIAADFDDVVWPAVTGAFGAPATPGVDGDPRITILHADMRGAGAYVVRTDGYPRTVFPLSNEREMLYVDSENLSAPGVDYNSLVAHELQHLVHYNADAGEEGWVNEGLSQVAAQLAGGGVEWIPQFLSQPDLQLNSWPPDGYRIPNYAAAELFFSYLLDHYGGRENAAALVNEPGDGIEGVEAYLDSFDATFDEVFADWTIANWLDAADGPYSHPNLSARTTVAREIAAGQSGAGSVHQYAADYLRAPAGALRFDGADTVSIGVPEHDGAFWWSNRGDSIDSRLTREIDLTGVPEATLTFDAWYETERDWDYAYVAVSTDEGETWTALSGTSTSAANPTASAYGPGYTGASGGWASEEANLGAYAGRRILIRFEYVTDGSVNLTGFAVDNIAVAEIGFADGAESASGWQAEGFHRTTGPLAQKFLVQVISADGSVQRHTPGAGNIVDLTLIEASTVVIVALTPGTTEPASYNWSLSP